MARGEAISELAGAIYHCVLRLGLWADNEEGAVHSRQKCTKAPESLRRDALEIGGVVRAAASRILCHLRIRAERPCADGAARGVFRGDDRAGRDAILYPTLQRG